MIKVITFDLDDTLYPEMEYVLSGFKVVSKVINRLLGIEDFYPELVKTFKEGESRKTFNITLKRFGIEYDELLIQNLVACYRAHFPTIKPYDDVLPILQHLKEKYHLALITDGYLQVQRNKVKALGIERFFEKIIYTDEYGKDYWKPSSFPFQLIMRHFSVMGNECAYIGDNVEKDFIAPNKLGWLTVQIKRKESLYYDNALANGNRSPQVTIDRLADLERVLEGGKR